MRVRISMEAVRERHAEIMAGGSTFTTTGMPIRHGGISVGGKIPGGVVIPAEDFSPEFLAGVMQGWSAHPHYVWEMGGWLDRGNVYLDAVDIVGEREIAEAIGRERGELAIFDLGTMTEIRL